MRIGYLGIADFDYRSARLLLLNVLAFSALPQAAEAFEYEAVLGSRGQATNLSAAEVRKFRHDWPKSFDG